MEDGDDDLLGGGDFTMTQDSGAKAEDLNEFESSFPEIDTRNDVSMPIGEHRQNLRLY